MPYFSTDTVSAQRALECHCDMVLMSKSGVDGVYDSDPRTNPQARKLDKVTFAEALRANLRVVDAAAFSLCMENRLPMVVFGMEGDGNITGPARGADRHPRPRRRPGAAPPRPSTWRYGAAVRRAPPTPAFLTVTTAI